jgi:polygalacturonase
MRTVFLFFAPVFLLISCSKKVSNGSSDSTPSSNTNTNTYIITNYGASTSLLDNTSFVQKTIDTCSAAGGGTVIVPAGTFLCGPVSLKSNITFKLESGAMLKALPYNSYPGAGTSTVSSFINGNGVSNITITGTGAIEGQGADWWTAYKNDNSIARPSMIRVIKCTNVNISNITIQNAPNVHVSVERNCDTVNITDLTINSPSNSPNTDGIDTWAPNVNISNCNISDGDDNIAIDSYSSNIHIKNCAFGTGHGCSIGSYTSGVHDITVDSCTFNGTTNGIRIKSNRGRSGMVQNMTYTNITMTGVTNPIDIVAYYPKTPSTPTADSAQPITSTTPDYMNITLKNITITGSANAGTIWGLPEVSISNITFDNVQISASTGMKAYFVTGAVFKNGSRITTSSGNAITTYNASISGINLVTGAPQ